jgi:hypothetical protein
MAYLHFDSKYAPCGFLIVPDGGDPYKDAITRLIQSDWDFPGVASNMGYVPCKCGATDGTVDCTHKTATEMITEAYDYCRERAGQSFKGLDEYLASDEDVRQAEGSDDE